jgi:hypothetical protein
MFIIVNRISLETWERGFFFVLAVSQEKEMYKTAPRQPDTSTTFIPRGREDNLMQHQLKQVKNNKAVRKEYEGIIRRKGGMASSLKAITGVNKISY